MRKSASSAKSLVEKRCVSASPRTSTVLSIFDEMLQQHDDLLQFCSGASFHSAIQQGRKLMLNAYRGIWICYCTTDEEKNADFVVPRSAFRMANEIDVSSRSSSDVGDLRKAVWCILGRYANFELEQIGRRKTGRGVEPQYGDELMNEMAMTSTNCLLLLAETLLRANGHVEAARKIAPVWQ
jgi:hypothetical protein